VAWMDEPSRFAHWVREHHAFAPITDLLPPGAIPEELGFHSPGLEKPVETKETCTSRSFGAWCPVMKACFDARWWTADCDDDCEGHCLWHQCVPLDDLHLPPNTLMLKYAGFVAESTVAIMSQSSSVPIYRSGDDDEYDWYWNQYRRPEDESEWFRRTPQTTADDDDDDDTTRAPDVTRNNNKNFYGDDGGWDSGTGEPATTCSLSLRDCPSGLLCPYLCMCFPEHWVTSNRCSDRCNSFGEVCLFGECYNWKRWVVAPSSFSSVMALHTADVEAVVHASEQQPSESRRPAAFAAFFLVLGFFSTIVFLRRQRPLMKGDGSTTTHVVAQNQMEDGL